MFERFKLTGEVKKAIERATAVLEERARIRQAIAKAEAMLPGAEAALQHAQEALAEAEADSALAAAATSTRAERNACADARVQLDAITARIAGLQKRLAGTDAPLLAAEEELAVARREFVRRILDDYRQDYMKATERFAEVLRVGRGLQEGLGRRLHVDFELVDPEHGDSVLVPLFERKYQDQAWKDQWFENSAARGAFESVVAVKNAVKELEREIKGIRDRNLRANAEDAQRRVEAERSALPASTVLTYPPEPPEPQVPNVEIRSARMFPDNPERQSEFPQWAHMNPSTEGGNENAGQ